MIIRINQSTDVLHRNKSKKIKYHRERELVNADRHNIVQSLRLFFPFETESVERPPNTAKRLVKMAVWDSSEVHIAYKKLKLAAI